MIAFMTKNESNLASFIISNRKPMVKIKGPLASYSNNVYAPIVAEDDYGAVKIIVKDYTSTADYILDNRYSACDIGVLKYVDVRNEKKLRYQVYRFASNENPDEIKEIVKVFQDFWEIYSAVDDAQNLDANIEAALGYLEEIKEFPSYNEKAGFGYNLCIESLTYFPDKPLNCIGFSYDVTDNELLILSDVRPVYIINDSKYSRYGENGHRDMTANFKIPESGHLDYAECQFYLPDKGYENKTVYSIYITLYQINMNTDKQISTDFAFTVTDANPKAVKDMIDLRDMIFKAWEYSIFGDLAEDWAENFIDALMEFAKDIPCDINTKREISQIVDVVDRYDLRYFDFDDH